MLQVQIRISGHIDQDWSDSLAKLVVTHSPDGSTVLAGHIRDQAALYGLLCQLCGLGVRLISFSSEENRDHYSLHNVGDPH